MEHHDIDIRPVPEKVIYINEPWMADVSFPNRVKDVDKAEDNIRIYVPIDLNQQAILRRLRFAINRYEDANEDNEYIFSDDVKHVIYQLEVYDQVWKARGDNKRGSELAQEIVEMLESIPDGCAEMFPFEIIDRLRRDFPPLDS